MTCPVYLGSCQTFLLMDNESTRQLLIILLIIVINKILLEIYSKLLHLAANMYHLLKFKGLLIDNYLKKLY